MKNPAIAVALTLSLTGAQGALAAEHTVAQKGKAFSAPTMAVKVGDKISFRNDDPFVHNVFSLTEPGSFDLGTYPQGQAKAVTFAKEGKFEIECAIHPEMKMVVQVGK